MGFKTDESFLRYLSMGVVGTQRVREYLSHLGHRMIELERGSGTNKVWAIKPKRVRVPDLICLSCGTRVESRAKSNLAIAMSHSPSRDNRSWDSGLRNTDLVAFVACREDSEERFRWRASEHVNLFRVEDLRQSFPQARTSQRKSLREGAEISVTWPSYVPKVNATVTQVSQDTIHYVKDDGTKGVYKLKGHLTGGHIHVKPGDQIKAGEVIAASIVASVGEFRCPGASYDFLADLMGEKVDRETLYAAVKAVSYLDSGQQDVIARLSEIAEKHPDLLIRLEAAASLARIGNDLGWRLLSNAAHNSSLPETVRMEAILVLGELEESKARDILVAVAQDRENHSELRAAAVWGLGRIDSNIVETVFPWAYDDDNVVAAHALTVCARAISVGDVEQLLGRIGADDRRSAAAVRILMYSASNHLPRLMNHLRDSQDSATRDWLSYLLGIMGRGAVEPYLELLGDSCDEVKRRVELLWYCYHRDWTLSSKVADQIESLRLQH